MVLNSILMKERVTQDKPRTRRTRCKTRKATGANRRITAGLLKE